MDERDEPRDRGRPDPEDDLRPAAAGDGDAEPDPQAGVEPEAEAGLEPEAEAGVEPAGRPWYGRTAVLVAAASLGGLLGQFWIGFLVIFALVVDRTRPGDVRAAGSVLTLWWLSTWTLPSGSPYPAFGLLVVAAGFCLHAARRERRAGRDRAALVGLATAVAAVALGIAALVPYGVREPDLGRTEALDATLAARRGHAENIRATDALVLLARTRFTKRPFYYVVLHEPHPTQPATGDGEPCFGRAETHVVDATSGRVRRGVVAEARTEDGGCLPVPVGTRAELVPVRG